MTAGPLGHTPPWSGSFHATDRSLFRGRVDGMLGPLGRTCQYLPMRRVRRVQVAAVVVPPQLVSTATSLGAGLQSAVAHGGGILAVLQSFLDPAVLAATVGASFKLFLICAAVGWLLHTNKIPGSTATVLSQVSFYLLIPAMLFSKVASTLSAQPSCPLLLTIVAVTLAQICIGALFGRALAPLVRVIQLSQVDGQYSRDRTILGWHPMNPARSAATIAASVGAATGVPLAAQALLPRTKAPPEGIRTLVALACAFGNSFTLPAVFFMTLLPSHLADRALGYAAVFMLAWSPMLWSLGYAMVIGGDGDGAGNGRQPPLTSPAAAAAEPAAGARGPPTGRSSAPALPPPTPRQQQQQQQRRVTIGPDWEVVEGPPPAEGLRFSPSNSAASPAASSPSAAFSLAAAAAGPSEPHRHPAIFDRVMHHQQLQALRQFLGQALNPPVLGILAGMAVGLTPWGRTLLASVSGGSAGAAVAAAAWALPPELRLLAGVLRSALEVVELMASGTLATQTLVLAASLLSPRDKAGGGLAPTRGLGPEALGSRPPRGLRSVAKLLLPGDAMEARALAILSLVRFLLLPLATLGLLWAFRAPACLDPLLVFVLLVEAVMPSGQNLIVLLQLSERTRAIAPSFAALLLKLYAYAILPCTLWVTAFATQLSIPVVR